MRTLLTIALLLTASPLFAQSIDPATIGVVSPGTAYYRVYVDDEEVSKHTTPHKAWESAVRHLATNPGADVRYTLNAQWVVTADLVTAPPGPNPGPPPPDPDSSIGDHVDADGWSNFALPGGAQVIHVSSSAGSDDNDGLTPESPVKTLYRAANMVSPDHPDWILFRAGDTFTGGIKYMGYPQIDGVDHDSPMVFGAYGEGPRPVFLCDGESAVKATGGGKIGMAFVGLEFVAHTRNPESPDFDADSTPNQSGFRWIGPGSHVLVEDCVFRLFKDGIAVQSNSDEPQLFDFVFRRNIVIDSWSNGGHSQGIFAKDVHGLTIEENVFDHNGWHSKAGGPRTIFSHNMYLANGSSDVVVRGNISTRGASHGLQFRPGGLCENNLFARNGLAMYNRGDTVRNVAMEGVDISETAPRGHGIDVKFRDDPNVTIEVAENLVVNRLTSTPEPGITVSREATHAVLLRYNIVRNYYSRDGDGIVIDESSEPFVTLEDNIHRANDTTEFVDPNRDFGTYIDGGFDAFIEGARSRQRGEWNPKFTAAAFNEYMREGFTPKE